jgi:hypothetical protein
MEGLFMYLNFNILKRVLLRSKEIVDEKEMRPIVVEVYKKSLEGPATAFLSANAAVAKASVALKKENAEALGSLDALVMPYAGARSAVMAILPETAGALPATLKSLPTDTDKLWAIGTLLEAIEERAGEAWADALLAGEFGTNAPATIKEVREAIDASKDAAAASQARAAAYGPACEKFYAFKRLVRDLFGASSKQYRRIHLRGSARSFREDGGESGSEGGSSSSAGGAEAGSGEHATG